MTVSDPSKVHIRRELRPSDPEAILAIHERIYAAEHGMDERFVKAIADGIDRAMAAGWPERGGIWLVERDGEVAGSLAWTDEGDGTGQFRWVVLDPALRGQGIGRRMATEAVADARAQGMERLELVTFGALATAAVIYRSLGFELVSERQTEMWGPPIAYQRYEMTLG